MICIKLLTSTLAILLVMMLFTSLPIECQWYGRSYGQSYGPNYGQSIGQGYNLQIFILIITS